MADKGPPKVKLIAVKPVADDGKLLPPLQSKNDNAVVKKKKANSKKARLITVKSHEMSERQRQLAEIDYAVEKKKISDKNISDSNEARFITVKPYEMSEDERQLAEIDNAVEKKKISDKKISDSNEARLITVKPYEMSEHERILAEIDNAVEKKMISDKNISDRNEARLITVKPYEMSEHERQLAEIDNAVEKKKISDKNISDRNEARLITVKPYEMSEHERQLAEIDSSFREVEMTFAKHVKDLPVAKEDEVHVTKRDQEVKELRNEIPRKKKKKIKKNAVMPLDVTKSDYLEGKIEEPRGELNIGEPAVRNGKKKKRKKKDKPKKKQKKKEKSEQASKNIETTNREPEQEVAAAIPQNTEHADDKKEARKLPCCFGFISTWLAKRKQKRREKKKKAIAERATPPKLVQYEHKQAKGGEAFIIEVDCRPSIQKPVLPPIKRTVGPIRRGTDYRLQTAEERRVEELAKRPKVAGTYERKKVECKERKADADNNFRKKAGLTIRYKQADAERNRNNVSRRAKTTRPTSIQSSSCESVIIESDPDAFKADQSDPDAWKVDDVDCFSY